MSACAAGQSVQSTGPVQAGRYWNGEAKGLSSCGELGKFVVAGAERRRALAVKAGEPAQHVHGVVGTALFAVIDDIDAAFDLLAHHAGDRVAHGGLEFGAARAGVLVLGEHQLDHLLAVRGRLPVWVVRMREVERFMKDSLLARDLVRKPVPTFRDHALKSPHDLGDVLDIRRRREAVADQLAPFLEIGRAAEIDGVVLQRLPLQEQSVARRLSRATAAGSRPCSPWRA